MVERGARAVLMRPAPVSGLRGTRSPFLPEFDPFWARVQETGVLVALHASDSGYQDYLNTWEGSEGAEYVAFRPEDVRGGRRRRALDPGHARLRGLPRHAHPVPRRAAAERRERRQLGRAAAQEPRARLQEDAQRVPRAPARRVPPQRLGEPVLGGLGHRPRRPRSAPTACASAPTTPTPRASTTRSPGGTSSTAVPAPDVEKIMSTNMFGLLGLAPPARPAA